MNTENMGSYCKIDFHAAKLVRKCLLIKLSKRNPFEVQRMILVHH